MNSTYKVFGFYFPQFYAIPENNNWWGEGFNDWKLVREATPITNANNNQPRVPGRLGYYDQSSPDIIIEQAKLAKKYGLSGFNFYHYWFDGKVLLDKPMQNLLDNKNIDIEFFFTWANESWTRQWVGKPNEILIKQSHTADEGIWDNHYNYLKDFFNDKRYTKIDNKPVFCIYRPELINDLNVFLKYFNKKARSDGYDGFYFIAFRSYSILDANTIYAGFDSLLNFQPRFSFNKYLKNKNKLINLLEKIARSLPEQVQLKIISALKNKAHTAYDYNEFIQTLGRDRSFNGKTVYQSICPDWDNTARYKEKSTFFVNTSVQAFENGLNIIRENLKDCEEKIVFINAWNEWSESAYLEPDLVNQYAYLEAVRRVFSE